MLNANIAEEKRKIMKESSEVIIISKGILVAALDKMRAIFGEDVICTLLYHVGRAVGLAIRDKYLDNDGSSLTDLGGLREILQRARDIGFIRLSSVDMKSGILKVIVDFTPDEICIEKSSPYPLLRGLIDGLLGNGKASIIDIRKGKELVEIYFLINGGLRWW